MASFTASGWSSGATVEAYATDAFGTKTGAAITSGTASSAGQVTFSHAGLVEGNRYVATDGSRTTNFKIPLSAAVTTAGAFRGVWQANTGYKAGQLVTQDGVLYAANADFTSGGSFSAANWTAVGGFANDAGQQGLIAPTTRIWAPSQTAVAVTNRLYLARLRTAGRPIAMVSFGFTVNVASSADDAWDFAIYDATGNRLAASGAVTGKVNSTGNKQVPLAQTLAANTTYYLGMVGVATSLLRFMGASYSANSQLPRVFGSAIPKIDAATADIGAATTPATLPALTAPTETPLMMALEF